MGCHAHTHEISRLKHKNLLVCLMKDDQSWPHTYTRETDRIYLKNLPTHPKKALGIRKRKRTPSSIKRFALQVNANKP